jgi:hypothetical protein
MAEGEVRTVGAIGEDALGNRTILVTRGRCTPRRARASTTSAPRYAFDNERLTWALKGGDGTQVVKCSNIVVDAVTSAERPDSPSGDPGDVPTALLVHRMDARQFLGVLAGGAAVTSIADSGLEDGGVAQDAAKVSAAPYSQTDPTFVEAAVANGKPAVRFVADSTKGVRHAATDNGSSTRYFAVSAVVPRASDTGAFLWGHGGGPSNLWAWINPDGTFGISVNTRTGENNQVSGTTPVDDGALHLVAWVFDRPGGVHRLYVDDPATAEASHACAAQVIADASFIRFGHADNGTNIIGDSAGFDLHDELHYAGVHDAAGRAAVFAALNAIWG